LTLFDAGWLVPGWPPELGGRNATPAQQMIYFEEFTRRGIVRSRNPQGLSIITPSILDYGTDQQKERFALPTLRAEIAWCLGMSEPNAGSDDYSRDAFASPPSSGSMSCIPGTYEGGPQSVRRVPIR